MFLEPEIPSDILFGVDAPVAEGIDEPPSHPEDVLIAEQPTISNV